MSKLIKKIVRSVLNRAYPRQRRQKLDSPFITASVRDAFGSIGQARVSFPRGWWSITKLINSLYYLD